MEKKKENKNNNFVIKNVNHWEREEKNKKSKLTVGNIFSPVWDIFAGFCSGCPVGWLVGWKKSTQYKKTVTWLYTFFH